MGRLGAAGYGDRTAGELRSNGSEGPRSRSTSSELHPGRTARLNSGDSWAGQAASSQSVPGPPAGRIRAFWGKFINSFRRQRHDGGLPHFLHGDRPDASTPASPASSPSPASVSGRYPDPAGLRAHLSRQSGNMGRGRPYHKPPYTPPDSFRCRRLTYVRLSERPQFS